MSDQDALIGFVQDVYILLKDSDIEHPGKDELLNNLLELLGKYDLPPLITI